MPYQRVKSAKTWKSSQNSKYEQNQFQWNDFQTNLMCHVTIINAKGNCKVKRKSFDLNCAAGLFKNAEFKAIHLLSCKFIRLLKTEHSANSNSTTAWLEFMFENR